MAEVREDANEEAIRASLQPKQTDQPVTQLKAATTKIGQDNQPANKALAVPNLKPKPKPKADPKANPKGDSPQGKAKDQEKDKGTSKGSQPKGGKGDATDPKPTVPCLYYPKGTCNRGD